LIKNVVGKKIEKKINLRNSRRNLKYYTYFHNFGNLDAKIKENLSMIKLMKA